MGSNPTLSAIRLRSLVVQASYGGMAPCHDEVPPKHVVRRRTNPTLSAILFYPAKQHESWPDDGAGITREHEEASECRRSWHHVDRTTTPSVQAE